MLFRSNDTATTEIYTRPYTLSLHDALPFSVSAISPRLLPKFAASSPRANVTGPLFEPVVSEVTVTVTRSDGFDGAGLGYVGDALFTKVSSGTPW